MRPFLATLFLVCLMCCAAFSQQSTADPQIVATFNGISTHAARIEPMLQQLRPNDWVAKGGGPRYCGFLPYDVPKAGVIALTEALALELAPDNILVDRKSVV